MVGLTVVRLDLWSRYQSLEWVVGLVEPRLRLSVAALPVQTIQDFL